MKKIYFNVNEFHLMKEIHFMCSLLLTLLEMTDLDLEKF